MVVLKVLREFARGTSIHGFGFLVSHKISARSKIIWAISLVVAMMYASAEMRNSVISKYQYLFQNHKIETNDYNVLTTIITWLEILGHSWASKTHKMNTFSRSSTFTKGLWHKMAYDTYRDISASYEIFFFQISAMSSFGEWYNSVETQVPLGVPRGQGWFWIGPDIVSLAENWVELIHNMPHRTDTYFSIVNFRIGNK